jgi:acylpyruvate hydrolase
MRLVSFLAGERLHIGAMADESTLVDLNRMQPGLPSDMAAFLALGHPAIDQARQVLSSAKPEDLLAMSDVTLLAPVPRPEKILCVGHNYKGHIGIGRHELPVFPDIFIKTANTLTGHGHPILAPRLTPQVDYEAELAVVIGKRGRCIPETEAMRYVAGYAIFNDVSARDIQKRTSQWALGKSFDTFGPLGPALVTADEVPDPHCLDLVLTVNGVPKQRANTRDLIFSVPFLVSYLSEVMTLEPGDILATGTPAKLPEAANPHRFLEPGDTVEITIGKIGKLTNPVMAETTKN